MSAAAEIKALKERVKRRFLPAHAGAIWQTWTQDGDDPDLWRNLRGESATTEQVEALSGRVLMLYTNCYLPGRKGYESEEFENE